MASSGAIVATVVFGGALIIGVAYAAAKAVHPVQTPTVLMLTASSTELEAGQSDTFKGTLLDQNNLPIANYPLSLNGIKAQQTNTDSSGIATWQVPFPNSGTYSIYASS